MDFRIERWEYVPGGGATALLRLAGDWPKGQRPSPGDVELLLEHGDGGTQYSPLPDPTAATSGLEWRAAFAVDAGAVEPSTTYRLSVPGGGMELPQPVQRGASVTQEAPGVEEEEATERRRSFTERVGLGSIRQRQVVEGAPVPHQARAGVDTESRAQAEHELQTERERRLELESDVAMWRAREGDERTRRETAEARVAEAVADAARVGAQAESAQERFLRLEARIEHLSQSMESKRAERTAAVEAERRVVELTQDLARTKAELEATARERESSEGLRVRLEEELVSLREGREELAGSLEELRLEHSAAVEALAVARRDGVRLAEGRAELEAELGAERSATQGMSEQLQAVEAERTDRVGELEEAMSQVATLTQARDQARLRMVALERALAESDEQAPEGSASDAAELAGSGAEQGAWGSTLERLRTEAVQGQERAAMIEARLEAAVRTPSL